MEFLGFHVISGNNRKVIFYVFCSNADAFIFFSCLIVLGRTSNTMVNKIGESKHACIIPDLLGKTFNFLPLSRMLAVVLSYIAFSMFHV